MKKVTTPKKKTAKKKTAKKTSVAKIVKDGIEKIAEAVEAAFSSPPKDITVAIKLDHEGLRNFLDVLKDTDRDMGERRRAYVLFADLLKSHTKAEEAVVYKTMAKMAGREMHIKIAEGYVEHHVAEDLMTRIEACDDATDWSAHANVLSESVEHHLREEERDLLPLVRKATPAKLDFDMLGEYLTLRAGNQKKVTEKNAGVLEILRRKLYKN